MCRMSNTKIPGGASFQIRLKDFVNLSGDGECMIGYCSFDEPLSEDNISSIKHGFLIKKDSIFSIKEGQVHNYLFNTNSIIASGDYIRVAIHKSLNKIRFIKEYVLIDDYTIPTGELDSTFQVKVMVNNAQVEFSETISTFGYINTTNDSYCAELKKELDGSFVEVLNNELKFTYEEDYPIVFGENDEVNYSIYNWKRVPIISGVLTNNYGVNYHEIDLSQGNFWNFNYYTLEVKIKRGDKGEETYYLRFKGRY